MSNRKVEARERVKAMREEQARKERRREQMLRFGIVAAVLVAIAIIGVAVMANRGGDVDTEAALPAGVSEPGGGVPAVPLAADVPTVEVWFDFSCPHCASFEAANGPFLKQLAEDGEANLVYRPVTFVGQAASMRATNAWACALGEDMGEAFMDAAYAQQGAYANRDLITAGESVGIDSSEFRSCVNDSAYEDWVLNSHSAGVGDYGVGTTPTVFVVNGDERTEVESTQWTPEGLMAAVEAASGGGAAPDEGADDEAEE
jgi:protein-disulfide isomerase